MEEDWISNLKKTVAPLAPLADEFINHGYKLYLVGGIVRDSILGSQFFDDFDLTTDAPSSVTKAIMATFCDALWTQGEKFGTIGGLINSLSVEITTHRGESYSEDSRKPLVEFSDSIDQDLVRRDFTINAIAVELPGFRLVDPYSGVEHLRRGLLRTPLDATVSFSDDPLRMFRAARFLSKLSLKPDESIFQASVELVHRVEVVSVERIRDELEKLILLENPRQGLSHLFDAGLMANFLNTNCDQEIVENSIQLASCKSSVLVKRCGLLWFFDTSEKDFLKLLKYSTFDQKQTKTLQRVTHEIINSEPTDFFIRQLAHDHGAELIAEARELIKNLKKVDSTINCSVFESNFDRLSVEEDLENIEVPLSGAEVMQSLNIQQGPQVGQAMGYLLDHILHFGPISSSDAFGLLKKLKAEGLS